MTLIIWLQLNANIKERDVNTVHGQWTVKFVHSRKIAEQLQLMADLRHTDFIKLRTLILAICKNLAQNNQYRLLQAVQSNLLSILCFHQVKDYLCNWLGCPFKMSQDDFMHVSNHCEKCSPRRKCLSISTGCQNQGHKHISGWPLWAKSPQMSWAFRNHLAFL